MMRCKYFSILLFLALGLTACSEGRDLEGQGNMDVPSVVAQMETTPVTSKGDAADDPAIWVHPTSPEKSLILGTDKKSGLYLYNLAGDVVDFQKIGRVNNVDIRQNLNADYFSGYRNLSASSNRSTNAVDLVAVSGEGKLDLLGSFPVQDDPYGLCVGSISDGKSLTVLVNYKSGLFELYAVAFPEGRLTAEKMAAYQLGGQLEGCVIDDARQQIFIGEEEKGIWRFDLPRGKMTLSAPVFFVGLTDETGLVADVEGLDLYIKGNQRYLVASSQGDFTYVIFRVDDGGQLQKVSKFRIGNNDRLDVDAVEETDGLTVTSLPLGAAYPEGVLLVQDGMNKPTSQNFKLVDWREIMKLIKDKQ